ncbi:DUF3515 domain-containing protein [Nocardia pneumoniae]|uniref:DUF3515 domain-containing protein n=1 Tax=Nocardia pneumoniae TaxID=228601 RepID=UPI00031EC745|nr:DUF3515 domain-containing protein [Nocardia pneumoniae]
MAADSSNRDSTEHDDEHAYAATSASDARDAVRKDAADAAGTADAPTPSPDTEPAQSDADDADGAATEPDRPAATPQYSPALIATAVALPVVLVVAVLVAAVLARRAPVEREPLVLGPVPAPAADGPACAALLPALPADLGDFSKSTLVEPAPPATRAWQRTDGGDPIVLRCGLDRPLEFNRASPLQIVNGVQWFEVRDQTAKASTWFAVDRGTYIALTVPDGSGPTPLQEVSDTITATLPAQPIDPGPLPN